MFSFSAKFTFKTSRAPVSFEENTVKHDSTSDSMVSDNQVDHTEAVFAMFSLAIDFLDEFGLERLTEPEKPLNEMSSDCK